jgi:transposase
MSKPSIDLTNEDLHEKIRVEDLYERIRVLERENAKLTAKLDWYERQYWLAMQQRYGASSERTPPEQRQLFNEPEAEAKPSLPEPTFETITYRRKKKAGRREEILKDLPVEVIEHRLPEEERICERCGSVKHEMSKQVKRVLEIIPAQVKVREDVYFVYSCRACEHNETTTPIVTAKMPASVIPGSLASPSAIAHIMTQKYVMGMPLYRQEQQLHQLG